MLNSPQPQKQQIFSQSILITPPNMFKSQSIKQEVKDFIDSTYHPNIFPTDGYQITLPQQEEQQNQSVFYSSFPSSFQQISKKRKDSISNNESLVTKYHTLQAVNFNQEFKFPFQTIPVIEGIVNACIHLRANFFTPCQIKCNDVVFKQKGANKIWGIKYAVCYRQRGQNTLSNSLANQQDNYEDSQFQFHKNEQSQLVWSIGKIWYYLIFNKEVLPHIQKMKQYKLHEALQKKLGQAKKDYLGFDSQQKQKVTQKMIDTLKKILDKNSSTRISFDQLVDRTILFTNCGAQQHDFNVSLVKHFSIICKSSNNIAKSNKQFNSFSLKQSSFVTSLKHDSPNPFIQILFLRSMTQYYHIDRFIIEQCKIFVRDELTNPLKFPQFDGNKQELFHACYIIDLYNYIRYKELETNRQEQKYVIFTCDQFMKKSYSKFIQRMYLLLKSVQRTKNKFLQQAKTVNSYKQIVKNYSYYYQNPEKIDRNQIYDHFKQYLTTFIKILKKKFIAKGKIDKNHALQYQKNVIKLFLARTSKYIFNSSRSHIFGDFMNSSQRQQLGKSKPQDLSFDKISIDTIVFQLNQCKSIDRLIKLEKKIVDLYFSNNK